MRFSDFVDAVAHTADPACILSATGSLLYANAALTESAPPVLPDAPPPPNLFFPGDAPLPSSLFAFDREPSARLFQSPDPKHKTLALRLADDDKNPVLGLIRLGPGPAPKDDALTLALAENQRLKADLAALVELQGMVHAPIPTVSAFVLETAVASSRSQYGFINRFDKHDGLFKPVCYSSEVMRGCAMPESPRIFDPADAGWWTHAAQARTPFVVNDYHTAAPAKKGLPEGHVPLERILITPVLDPSHDRVDLILAVANKPERYTQNDVDQLTLLAQGLHRHILRKRREDELVEAHQAALAADKAKSAFLANMSHEIRTPLSGMLGFVNLLRTVVSDPEQKEYLHYIETSGKSLTRLLTDILDFSKIEAGALDVVNAPFRLAESIKTAVEPFLIDAKIQGLALTLDFHKSIPEWVFADEARIRQILLNLVGNAVKFTEKGEITVSVDLLENHEALAAPDQTTGRQALLVFCVADTGPGMAAEHMERMFEPFAQAQSRKIGKSGVGLGLAIVKRVLNLLGGRIAFRSQPGMGTDFTVEIPVAVPAQTAESTKIPKKSPKPGLRVLVAEDDAINALYIKRRLELSGHRVVVAKDGREALAYLANTGFDCALLDVSMPEIDGETVLKQLKAHPLYAQNSRIPAIAMTAHAMRGDKERFLELGFDHYLPKPIDPQALADTLRLVAAAV